MWFVNVQGEKHITTFYEDDKELAIFVYSEAVQLMKEKKIGKLIGKYHTMYIDGSHIIAVEMSSQENMVKRKMMMDRENDRITAMITNESIVLKNQESIQ